MEMRKEMANISNHLSVAEVLMQQVPLDMGESVIERVRKLRSWKLLFVFCVVDSSGHLVVFRRMPNVILASIKISIRKARTGPLPSDSDHGCRDISVIASSVECG
jgi:uncharacterized protein GlcG (DUF336 family)